MRPDETELDDELRGHLALEIKARTSDADDPEQARRAAQLELGYLPAVREEMRRVWYSRWSDEMVAARRDLRFAVRALLRNKALSLTVIMTLAVGVGVNATLFSVLDGVLIQSLPFLAPERLVVIGEASPRTGRDTGGSYPGLLDIRERVTSLSAVGASRSRVITLAGDDDAERVPGAAVTANLFQTLGVLPHLGRDFRHEDDQPGAVPVVMLSYEIWQQRYQGDEAVIGRSLDIDGTSRSVIGVMPPRFSFPETQKVWIPLGPEAKDDARDQRNLLIVGRLTAGAELLRARAELASIASTLATLHPVTNDGWSATVHVIRDKFIPPRVRLVLATMMGAVTLVLLVACANVANLMLARASARVREFCVRAALGAGRARLVRQLLTEAMVLGLATAPLGLLLAYGGVWLLDHAVSSAPVPSYLHWEISSRVVAYTVLLSALAGLVFGLAPALQAGKLDLHEALRDGARGAGQYGLGARVRQGLVVVEVALAVVLLIGASLFVRSFVNLQGTSPGFDTAPLLTVRVSLLGEHYATADSKAQRVEDIVRRVEALPEVVAAFASSFVPLDGGESDRQVMVDGRAVAAGEEPTVSFTAVTPHLYSTMALPMLEGRAFTDTEGSGLLPVAVINHTMATRLWPGGAAVGRRFRLVGAMPPDWFTVIGVAPDIRTAAIDDRPPVAAAYVPYRFANAENVGLTIRTSGDHPATVAAAIRHEIRMSDPGLAIFAVRTMEDLRQAAFWQYRIFASMFGIFGVAALCLAGTGVYGVLSFSVSQRTQEIGVRMALGASRGAARALVVKQGAWLAAIGILVGLVAAGGVTGVIRSLLYHVAPIDPLSFGGVTVFLAAVALVASYLPARRATNVDPLIALRSE